MKVEWVCFGHRDAPSGREACTWTFQWKGVESCHILSWKLMFAWEGDKCLSWNSVYECIGGHAIGIAGPESYGRLQEPTRLVIGVELVVYWKPLTGELRLTFIVWNVGYSWGLLAVECIHRLVQSFSSAIHLHWPPFLFTGNKRCQLKSHRTIISAVLELPRA